MTSSPQPAEGSTPGAAAGSQATPQRASAKPLIVALIAVALGLLIALVVSPGSATLGGVPLFLIGAILAFVIQWIAFVPSWLSGTERFYDLTGGLTYVGVTLFLLVASGARGVAAWVAAIMVGIWSVRLAGFLFARVLNNGGDGRFDEIKTQPLRLLQTWTLQGLWVVATASAAWAIITDPSGRGVDAWLVIGGVVWLVGLGVEAVADQQKRVFRAGPGRNGGFISTGLWALSRHPNYLGEIILWLGLAIAAVPSLEGWRWVALISPIFVTLLLTKLSGVPLLERRSEQRWGQDPAYGAYVDRTPILVPWVGRRGIWEKKRSAA